MAPSIDTSQPSGGAPPVNPSGYDPLNPTPYTAPDAANPPPITAPPPLTSEDKAPQSPSTLLPHTKGSVAASIATIGSSILHGAMQGRDRAQQIKAQKANRLMQGLQANYQSASDSYLEKVRQTGGMEGLKKQRDEVIGGRKFSELSDEDGKKISEIDAKMNDLNQADAAADASWMAMRQMYGNYLFPDAGKTSKKAKKGDQEVAANPMAILSDPNAKPPEKLKAWYDITGKVGRPDKYRAQQYSSPDYQKQLQLQRGEQRIEGDVQGKRIELHDLENTDPSKLNDKQKQRLQQLKTDPELFPKMGGAEKKVAEYVDKDDKKHIIWQKSDSSTEDRIESGESVREPVSMTKGKQAWAKDSKGKVYSVLLDPKTNQPMPGTEDYTVVPPADAKQQVDSVRTGEFSWKDENGVLHRSQTTTTTTHSPHGGGAGGGTGHTASASSGGSGHAASSGSGHTPTASTTPGDRIIGSTGPQGQTKSRADAGDSVLRLLPKVKELINDPDVREQLGALSGRWSEVENKLGTLDPKTRELLGSLKSIYSLSGTMHGWRSIKVADEFEKAYGGLHTDPDSLLAGMQAMEDTAKTVYETGYKHPWGQQANSGGGAGGGGSASGDGTRTVVDSKGNKIKVKVVNGAWVDATTGKPIQ
jgi:hypothetical protein